MEIAKLIIGLTVIGLVLYYFVGQADKSSQFIKSASQGYASSVTALQGNYRGYQ